MKKIKMISTALIVFVLMFEACYALTGDSVTIYKTSKSAVTSLSVSSPNNSYSMYVSAYGNDGYDLTVKAYGRNGVNDSYKVISGSKMTVDYGASKTNNNVNSSYEFVRIKLSGWGQGVGRLTAK